MSNFISTEATTVLSFLCRNMPNLLKCIMQFSIVPIPGKKINSLQLVLLTPQQIRDAREHPSGLVKHALRAVATIQAALNQTTSKLEVLAMQRNEVESALAALLETQHKG